MASGLLFSTKNGSNLKLENVNLVEEFEGLKLRNKYGLDLGEYTSGDKIHVILKYFNEGETQIYLKDNKIEVKSIMNKAINKAVEDFSVDEKRSKRNIHHAKETWLLLFLIRNCLYGVTP